MDRCGELRFRAAVEQRLHALAGALRRQRARPDRNRRGVGKDLGERHGERSNVDGAYRHEQHHRQVAIRRLRNRCADIEGSSAHWASSMVIRSGRSRARLAVSQ